MSDRKLGTLCFASCTGCHMALVDLGAGFLSLLSGVELAFSPVLVDRKELGEVDVVLVEGAVRNEEDLDRLRQARARAQILVALGTCATFGGVPGLADLLPVEEMMAGVYGKESLGRRVPAQRPRLLPLDSYVEVDTYVPGCPPPREHLGSILTALLSGGELPRIDTPVCSECGRTAGPEPLDELVRTFTRQPDRAKCLMVQGYVCLGSATRGGCGAACPDANMPCAGCRGPTDHILLESRHGVYRDIVNRISHMLGLPVRQVEYKLKDLPGSLYGYSLASPALRQKDAERVSQLVYRIKKGPPA